MLEQQQQISLKPLISGSWELLQSHIWVPIHRMGLRADLKMSGYFITFVTLLGQCILQACHCWRSQSLQLGDGGGDCFCPLVVFRVLSGTMNTCQKRVKLHVGTSLISPHLMTAVSCAFSNVSLVQIMGSNQWSWQQPVMFVGWEWGSWDPFEQ